MVNRGSVSGCCASSNFYNLGAAHGHVLADSQEKFDQAIIAHGYSSINIAIINASQYQTKLRQYLETQGWKIESVGGLYLCSISYNNLYKYLHPISIRLKEEERKKKLEHKKKLEEERKKRLERKNIELKLTPSRYNIGKSYLNGRSTLTFLPHEFWRLKERISEDFDINMDSYLPRRGLMTNRYIVSAEGLCRAITNRINKKHEDG